MSALAQDTSIPSAKDLAPVPRERRRRWTYYTLPVYSSAFFLYLLIPITFMVVYSFNQSHSALPQVTSKWQGFTTQWYRQWNGVPDLTPAFFLSIKLALIATVISATLGTLLALSLVRYRPMLEQAAQDLGATPWVTFWKITLPLIFPGILAGALLAFALSIDDFVTSNFVAGSSVTFPLWVYGAVKVGIPPQVFVLGTAIFSAGLVLAVLALVFQGRAKKARPEPEEG